MAQTTEMKKRKFTKVFALLLAMVMVLALPVEASAAAKVTAVTKETKAKAVKDSCNTSKGNQEKLHIQLCEI